MPWQSQAFLIEEGVARSVTEGVNVTFVYAQPYSLSFACAQQRLALPYNRFAQTFSAKLPPPLFLHFRP